MAKRRVWTMASRTPAQWLLDNTYLIRSHIAEIRHNLPDNRNKILPVIAQTRLAVRLRIYHIAADLMCRTGYRITPDSIVTYLNAYQQQAPLTIAELWVFPLMLRLVLLQRLQRLSELTSLRQHQKEMARDLGEPPFERRAAESQTVQAHRRRVGSRRRGFDSALHCASR